MKIRTWLLLSYLVVLLLPSLAAYGLWVWVNDFYDEKKVEEYIRSLAELQALIPVLDNPELYRSIGPKPIDQYLNPLRSITLYNEEGLILYASDPLKTSTGWIANRELLYKNLYALEQGYRAYTYKQPVFEDGKLIGFFEVTMSREQWVRGVNRRTWVMVGLLAALFLVTYGTVVALVQRKLNRRLLALMEQMSAFARQEKVMRLPVKNDEIGELTRHFYQMQEQIEAARERISQEQREKEYMVATISHDLKTPLTSIRAYAEALAHEQPLTAKERQDYLSIILEKANFMQQMLDDLTMHTVLQSSSYRLERVEVDGSEYFEMLLSDYEPLCAPRGIKLQVVCDVSGVYRLDPHQLMRVADNLVSNALQHTPAGGRIGLAAVETGRPLPEWLFSFAREQIDWHRPEGVFLVVQNEGEGIPQEKLPFIFDPLYQVDQARSKKGSKGTGLGLSISKQIMEKHGGTIEVATQEDLGTCVVCYLPKY